MLFLGGYTPDTGGSGVGIAVARDADGRLRSPAGRRRPEGLTVGSELAASGPSFLAAHPRQPVLYAVHERDDGAVGAFAIGRDGRLTPLVERSSGGAAPCHIAVDPAGSVLAVANYSGVLAVFRLDPDGLPTGPVWTFPGEGTGPDRDRQAGPHAHQAVFAPDGTLLVVDLGADRIRRYAVHAGASERSSAEGSDRSRSGASDAAHGGPRAVISDAVRMSVSERSSAEGVSAVGIVVAPHPAGPVELRPGSGPRHLVGDGHGRWYVVNELDATVAAYRETPDGGWQETDRVPASAAPARNLPSHIAMYGNRLLVANRGPDSLSVFDVDGDRLARRGEVATGGRWPRHFAIAGGYIYVANQRSDAVTVLALPTDGTGLPEPTGEALRTGSPTCVLPYPSPGDHELVSRTLSGDMS